ncbi:hypothetical protein CANARDRAFT_8089 [[Candida] arabinofermentans NRRL YB-2248]|uniref:PQ loop repeat protein n=1 Tax=[Candida] arabinofermentans NRRL YB-2248 TaxID=983967 RepID=A0A1E4SZL0_9ASCO|nr:hypothetical protein CANARDRAFT_8089 [[Candida] arabinofermentans NRRL YB-2248]
MADTCAIYEAPSLAGFILGSLLAVGIYVSYVPQHLKIISRKSSEGLSPLFLFLGSASGFAAFANLYLISLPARACCRTDLNNFQCLNSQLGFIQVGSQMVGYTLILILCVYLTERSLAESKRDFQSLYRSYQSFIFFATVVTVISVYMAYINRDYGLTLRYANVFGLISTALSVSQYIPQIYTTYCLKHPGSLSIPMMILQTPGGFIWSLSLYLQPGSRWSSWLPYLSAAFMQLVLLLLCFYFRWRYDTDRDEINAIEQIEHENIVDETTPLLTEA